MRRGVETIEQGPAAIADFDQTRAEGIAALRKATHAVVAFSVYRDAEGELVVDGVCAVCPSDRDKLRVKEAYAILTRAGELMGDTFAAAIEAGSES